LDKRYNDTLSIEDAVHMACMTMKEVFEGDMNEDNIEVGVIDDKMEFK